MTDVVPVRRPRRGPAAALLIRQLHSYFSVFIAPSILFFAITGCLQVFSLHEAHGDYRPAPIVEKLAAVHKDQVFETKRRRAPPPGARGSQPERREPKEEPRTLRPKVLALKILFEVVGAGLIATTLLGLWMAVTYSRRPRVCWALLAAGVIAPLLSFLLPG
jgi:hypothetical protein